MLRAGEEGGRATRYQVRGHRLYRSPDCMFPAHCAGIEYFLLLLLLPSLPDTEFVVNVNVREILASKKCYD